MLRKPQLFLWTIALPVNQELGASFPLTDIQETSNGICRAAVNNVWGGGRSEGGTRSETGFSTDGRLDAACGRKKLKVHSRGVHNLIHFKGTDEMRSQFTKGRWSKVCEQLHTLAWLTGGAQSSAKIVLLLGLPRVSQAAKHYQSAIRWLAQRQCSLILLNINPRGLIPQGSHEGRHPSDGGHRSYGHIPPKAIKNSRRQAVLPRHRMTGELGGMSSLQNILANRLQNKKPVERNITGTWVSLDQEAAHTKQEGPGS